MFEVQVGRLVRQHTQQSRHGCRQVEAAVLGREIKTGLQCSRRHNDGIAGDGHGLEGLFRGDDEVQAVLLRRARRIGGGLGWQAG